MRTKLSTGMLAIATAGLLLASLAGCGGGGTANTPTGVAESFVKALVSHDAGASYCLMSDQSKGETGMTLQNWNGFMLRNPIPKSATFTVKAESAQGNTATVTITPAGGTDQVVNLVNENGSWKVNWQIGDWYGLAPSM